MHAFTPMSMRARGHARLQSGVRPRSRNEGTNGADKGTARRPPREPGRRILRAENIPTGVKEVLEFVQNSEVSHPNQ